MKKIKDLFGWKITFFLSVVTAALIVSWTAGAQGEDTYPGKMFLDKKIEGTWKVRISPPAQTNVPPFNVLMTFTENGGLIETNNAFPPAAASPGHGAWERLSANRYAFEYTKFLVTPQGAPNGTLRIKGAASIGFSVNNFNSPDAVAEFYDNNGNLLFANPSPGVAERVRIRR